MMLKHEMLICVITSYTLNSLVKKTKKQKQLKIMAVVTKCKTGRLESHTFSTLAMWPYIGKQRITQ